MWHFIGHLQSNKAKALLGETMPSLYAWQTHCLYRCATRPRASCCSRPTVSTPAHNFPDEADDPACRQGTELWGLWRLLTLRR